jgi:hypothetical protein
MDVEDDQEGGGEYGFETKQACAFTDQ